MPRIPRTQVTERASPNLLTPPSTAGFGASGRATQQLGNAIASFGGVFDAFAEQSEKNDRFDTDNKLMDHTFAEDQAQFEAGQKIDGDGRDHVQNSIGRFDQSSQNLLNTIPESQRQRAALQIKRQRLRIQNEAQGQQRRHQEPYHIDKALQHGQTLRRRMITGHNDKSTEGILKSGLASVQMFNLEVDRRPISTAKKVALKQQNVKETAKNIVEETNDPSSMLKFLQSAEKEAKTKTPKKTAKFNGKNIRAGIIEAANTLGINPVDLATAISFETAGTFNPVKRGPKTKWGRHRGLIQFGEPQAKKFGVDWRNPVGSQLGANGAVVKYLRAAGVKKGMGLLQVYAAINAGSVHKIHASDAKAGGTPGSVLDKVRDQMAGHRAKAERLIGDAAGTQQHTDPLMNELMSPGNIKRLVGRQVEVETTNIHNDLKTQPNAIIADKIDIARDQLEKNPNDPNLERRLKIAEGYLKKRKKGLKNDPLQYADDESVVEIPSLIGQKDVSKALDDRVKRAKVVADIYQIKPTYLKQEEKAFIAHQYNEMDYQQKGQFLANIATGAKGETRNILSELNGVDPSMAHVGGLYLHGRKEAALMAMQGADILKDKALKNITENIKNADVLAAYQTVFGDAFGPNTIRAAGPFMATAKAIAATLLLKGGHTPTQAIEEGLRLATGYKEIDGEQYGGIAEFNDQKVLIHPDHKADDVIKVFDFLTSGSSETSIPMLGAPRGAFDFFLRKDGVNPTNPITQRPVTAEELHEAEFISVGVGRYQILIDGVPLLDARKSQNLGNGLEGFGKGSEYVLDLSKDFEQVLRAIEDERVIAEDAVIEANKNETERLKQKNEFESMRFRP